MKLWSLFKADTTAEVFADTPDAGGHLPAKITDPDMHEGHAFYGLIKPEEWADFEIAAVPSDVPSNVYLVLYGDAPAAIEYAFHLTDTAAKADLAARSNGIGYVPVFVPRFGMVPK